MSCTSRNYWIPGLAVALLVLCTGCPSGDATGQASASIAGGDLSGADCEIWIAPGSQREVNLWYDSGTDASASPQPETLKIKMRSKNDVYCVGGQEIVTSQARTLFVEVLADASVDAVYLVNSSQPVTYTSAPSDLPDKDPSVFGVDVQQAGGDFALHVHYAGAALVIECEKGSCP